ncbi:MAG: LysR family transcriptional regulator [Terrimicrobiaceae bacterium]
MNLQINYHHLRYFLAVVEAGGVLKAARAIHVSAPTLSAQVQKLSDSLGVALFHRSGKRMVLTDAGRVVRKYAARIVQLGDELGEVAKRGDWGRGESVAIGLADTVPKMLLSRMLADAVKVMPGLVASVREGLADELFPALAAHQVDVVLCSESPGGGFRSLLHDRLLGTYPVQWMASTTMKIGPRTRLENIPLLVPTRDTALRLQLESVWARNGLRPRIRAEFDDLAAMYELAAAGAGAVPVSAAVAQDVASRYGLRPIRHSTGVADGLHFVTAQREFPGSAVDILARVGASTLGRRRIATQKTDG